MDGSTPHRRSPVAHTRIPHLRLSLALALLGLVAVASHGAGLSPAKLKELRTRAEEYEKASNWDRACDVYEELLRGNRGAADVQERYRHCLRRINQVRRHRDASYQKQVLVLQYSQ